MKVHLEHPAQVTEKSEPLGLTEHLLLNGRLAVLLGMWEETEGSSQNVETKKQVPNERKT